MSDSRSLEVFCSAQYGPWPLAERTMHAPLPGELLVLHTALAPHHGGMAQLATTLDQHEQDRAARFRFQRDRIRYTIGHGLLRLALGKALGIPAAEVPFARGRFGKPFVPGSTLEFNLSDTKDGILLAITNGIPVGADIETMDRETDHVRVGHHYFTPGEMEGIVDGEAGKRRFLELWTRKEAVLKASGVGIMEDLRSLRVDLPHNALTIRHPEFVRMSAPAYHVRTCTLGDTHIISLATPVPMEQLALASFPVEH